MFTHARIIAWLLLLMASATASTGRNYSFILGGNRAGTQKTQVLENGEIRVSFEFNDRGRGPKLDTTIRLSAGGLPVLVHSKGNDYFKSAVEEHFSVREEKASWKNPSEQGETKWKGNAYYVTANSTPEEAGLLARALLKSEGKRLALLPEGEARIEHMHRARITASGKERDVDLYAIYGLDFLPFWVWLDADQTFFAAVSPWYSTILEGWETAIDPLLKHQESFLDKRLSDLAKQLTHAPSGKIVIQNARVFDSEKGIMLPNQTVILSGNRIESIQPAAANDPVQDGAEVIDASGKTLLPGLWDMHAHLTDVDGILNLAAGITSVRDCANDIDQLTRLIRKYEQGKAIGPRVTRIGFIDGKGPYAGPSKVLVENEAEARAAVRKYAELEYDQIKIYSSLKPQLVPVIVEEARAAGMPVSGHIPAFMTAEQAVRLGLNEIHHANFWFLNFLGDTVKDTRTPLRFTAVAEHAALLDLDSKQVDSFLTLLKERGIVVDPTINIFEAMFVDRKGSPSIGLKHVLHRLPPQIRRQAYAGGLPVPEGMDQRYRDSFAAMMKMLKRMEERGIQIVAGTDGLAGFALHRELELYVQSGISTAKTLQIATLQAARATKRDREVGSITPGKLADLILVEGDPVADISNIRRVRLVIKEGKIYKSGDLYRSIGVLPD